MIIKKVDKQEIDGMGTGDIGGGGILPFPETLAGLAAGIQNTIHLCKEIRIYGIVSIKKKVGFKVTVMKIDKGSVKDIALVANIIIVFKDGGPCLFRFFNRSVTAIISKDKDFIGIIRIGKFL